MRWSERWQRAAIAAFVVAALAACTSSDQSDVAGETPSENVRQNAPNGFSVVASGDLLIHPRITTQATSDGDGARDYRKILAGITPAVSQADLALCHLEVPLAPESGPFSGYPAFSAPPEVADAIADAGYDSCSTASNHTLDTGPAGVRRTLDTLDSKGIKHTGAARSAAEASRPLIMNANGVKVAQLSYTYGFNGIELPAGTPWLANQIDPTRIIKQARKARAAGADVVIVSMHWGDEGQHEVTDEQRAVADRLLDDDAIDLIVGHHAHVVQPFDKVGGKWVAYGLGNSLARHDEPLGTTEEGVIARFHFTRDGDGGWTVDNAEYLPTLVDLGPPIRLVNLLDGDAGAVAPARRTEALRRTGAVLGSLGAADKGLHRADR